MNVLENMPKGGRQGKTTIASDLVKQKVYIDSKGNEVKGPIPGGFSNEVIKPADLEVPAQSPAVIATPEPTGNLENENPLAQAIKAQVQEAVKDSIRGIDINSMVQEAIKDAFKK